ncbi:hypothetical protein F5Y10DRAFT_102925 [Nemania abortiva]|nr:hypothetical protein F5Y10DRAFT_102925 [Nemania abortiva]
MMSNATAQPEHLGAVSIGASENNMESSRENHSLNASSDPHDDSIDPAIEPELSNAPAEGEATSIVELRERCAVLESKLDIIHRVFGPPDNRDEDSDFSSVTTDEDFYSSQNWKNALYFTRQIRTMHQNSQAAKRIRKQMDRRMRNETPPAAFESESARQISTAAFLKSEPAAVAWMDWVQFLSPKGDPEKSIMSPIHIVTGEPEPQLILQLTPHSQIQNINSIEFRDVRNSVEFRDVRASAKDTSADSLEQAPLPERVKIHSDALHAIFGHQFKKRPGWHFGEDRATVFLRPFKEFIYHEKGLREHLSELEKRFHNWDGKPFTENRDDPDTKHGPEEGTIDEDKAERIGNSITALLHLRCLMKFIDDDIKPRLEYIESGLCRRILFYDLWHLFKPGGEIVDQTEKQAYRIFHVQYPRHIVEDPWVRWAFRGPPNNKGEDYKMADKLPIVVHCAYIDFDGKQLGPVSVKFSIPSFGGLKDIKSLPIYPLRFAKDVKLRDSLVARGKMLLDITKVKPMYYVGFTLDTRDEIDSQVVVDFGEALTDEKRKHWTPDIESLRTAPDDGNSPAPCVAPCCATQYVRWDEHIDMGLTEDFVKSLIPDVSFRAPSLILSPRPLEEVMSSDEGGPTDEELVLMTYRAFGFILRTRKWAQLDLTFLKYENTDARNSALSAFERLELPDGHRQMVRSLVTQHFRNRQVMLTKDDQTDLVRGKGKGLIMLLHGAPGVGKTTTAEGVAELFEKPLFQITCGDLGTTARDVEQELERNFALASRWGCILLLDEADVFLSARERKDFERNGLVAVFLRVLEYYTGVLFLTTNRIGDFDEAFASRIHMSLYYPELDQDKTKKVFKLNLDLIQEHFDRQGRKITYDVSSIEDFAEQHFREHPYSRWNGRQIRNACQTALALAEFDAHGGKVQGEIDTKAAVALQLKHFRLVQTAYLDFGNYLGDIRGTQGDRRAIDYGFRAKSNTPYQTTPSRFSTMATRDSRHSSSPSAEYNNSYNNPYPAQGSQGNDPFQPLANQGRLGVGGGGGGYGASGSPNMGHQMYGQYGPQQGQMGPGGGYGGYDTSRTHGYTHPETQQAQADPRPYQQPNQQGQNWGNFGPGMNQGYPPAGAPQQGQGYQQDLQGQNPQGQPQYGRVMQNQPMPVADPSMQNQYSRGGSGGGPEGGNSGPMAQ